MKPVRGPHRLAPVRARLHRCARLQSAHCGIPSLPRIRASAGRVRLADSAAYAATWPRRSLPGLRVQRPRGVTPAPRAGVLALVNAELAEVRAGIAAVEEKLLATEDKLDNAGDDAPAAQVAALVAREQQLRTEKEQLNARAIVLGQSRLELLRASAPGASSSVAPRPSESQPRLRATLSAAGSELVPALSTFGSPLARVMLENSVMS